ncbi:MAG: DUF87 domain-containing protein [Thermodesulfobacteriota bacterium]
MMWLLYLASEGQERDEADELFDVLMHFQLNKDYSKKILLEPPAPTLCSGEYYLGDVIYPEGVFAKFGIREAEWIKHMLITGMSGVGKTNLAFHILRQLHSHKKPFLVFDWKKNYRDLRQLPEFGNLKVYTIGREVAPFSFNPLIPPPGSEPGQWLVKLIDVMKHAYFLGEGVEFLMREAIDRAYERHGVFDGGNSYPVFDEIRAFVYAKRLRGRMSLWQASAMRALDCLTYKRGLGSVLDTNNPINPQELLNSDIVMELDALSDADKVFFTEALLLWIYEYRKNEGKREKFKHAIVIEEGHHILSSEKEKHEGQETIMETCLRQIREFGEAVIVLDQEPSKLSESIKANTYCKITFNLGNGKDILDISSCLQLTQDQAEYIGMLPVGKAIISLSGRFYEPVLVAFPLVPVQKGRVIDASLRLINGA